MGNFAAHVVQNVCLGNAVEEPWANETKPVPIDGAQCASRKRPHGSMVMWQPDIRMLKIRDHHKPVVRPHVRHDVITEHIELAVGVLMGPEA